jgi:hypothetical protein
MPHGQARRCVTATSPKSMRRSADRTDGDGHHRTAGRDGRLMIVLDADLPPPTTMSGFVGLDQLTTINPAVGMLIDQGHQPNQAHAAGEEAALAHCSCSQPSQVP